MILEPPTQICTRRKEDANKGEDKEGSEDNEFLALVLADFRIEPSRKRDNDVTRHEQYTFEPIYEMLDPDSANKCA